MNKNNDWLDKIEVNKIYKRICLFFFSLFFLFFCCRMETKAAVKLSKQKLTLRTGSAYALKLYGATQSVKWTLSSNGIVETVYAGPDQAIVRAKKPGVVKLSATIGVNKRTCKITVKKEVSFPKTKTILVGDRIRLKAAGKGKWKISNDSVVTLSKKKARSNSVKAVNTGRVTVSVGIPGKIYKCKIKVIDIPKGSMPVQKDIPSEEPEKKTDDLFPDNLVGLYSFGSGSGAWGSNLILSKDGSFTAKFNKTSMSSGNGYSYSRSVGSCTGKFEITKKISPLCFEMKIVDYKDDVDLGTTWIEDGCQFTATGINGLESNDNCVFYLKGSPRNTLPEHLRDGGIMISFTEDGLLKTGFIYIGGATFVGPF